MITCQTNHDCAMVEQLEGSSGTQVQYSTSCSNCHCNRYSYFYYYCFPFCYILHSVSCELQNLQLIMFLRNHITSLYFFYQLCILYFVKVEKVFLTPDEFYGTPAITKMFCFSSSSHDGTYCSCFIAIRIFKFLTCLRSLFIVFLALILIVNILMF